jgi:hypothetical protein
VVAVAVNASSISTRRPVDLLNATAALRSAARKSVDRSPPYGSVPDVAAGRRGDEEARFTGTTVVRSPCRACEYPPRASGLGPGSGLDEAPPPPAEPVAATAVPPADSTVENAKVVTTTHETTRAGSTDDPPSAR